MNTEGFAIFYRHDSLLVHLEAPTDSLATFRVQFDVPNFRTAHQGKSFRQIQEAARQMITGNTFR